ncbi:hypothetical protein MPL3356_340100 [Mesorhizobium plurifarium]|uniref:Uncharacterized protein n=1 Tax=Mesorhizobium plurifarium TaxID=69974 RepID=A0A090E1I6_MESPL|nr:hypothetical protein MPL3356_340100 [Mesorhizobium plurifarium]
MSCVEIVSANLARLVLFATANRNGNMRGRPYIMALFIFDLYLSLSDVIPAGGLLQCHGHASCSVLVICQPF